MSPLRMNQILKAGIIILLLSMGGVMYIGDGKISSLAQTTSQLKAEVEVNEKEISVYKQTKAKVESLKYVNELSLKVLPPDQEQSVIVAEVSEFANRSSLQIDQINFVDAGNNQITAKPKSSLTIPSGVSVIPITVQFKPGAQYSNILDFLKTIESNRRKMQVTNVSLTPNPENRLELNQVSISLNLYAKQTNAKGTKQ